jgi:hypothetical protein
VNETERTVPLGSTSNDPIDITDSPPREEPAATVEDLLSPRSFMCAQPGVSGQTNKRRKKPVEQSTGLINVLKELSTTWSKIEN